MKVTQEKLPASQIGLDIEVPADKSKAAYEKVLQEFSRTVRLPGFRKGKIPRHILIQQLGRENLKAAAIEELVQSSVQEAIKQAEIEAIGSPQLKSEFNTLIGQFKPGEPFSFKAAVDVPPEVKLEGYQGLTVKAEEIKPDPEGVEKLLADERDKRATLIPVEDRACQLGDVAVVDFVGRKLPAEGTEDQELEEIPGASAKDFSLEMESSRFIPGFIDGIVGMQLGETRQLDVKFPDEYPQEDIAGHPARFEVTVKEIKEKELPELDDEFADEISEFDTLDALKESLTTRFAQEATDKTKTNKYTAFEKALLEIVDVDLPASLVEDTVTQNLTQMAMQLANQGMDVNSLLTKDRIPQLREMARPEAINSLKTSLAIAEVAKLQSLHAEESEIEAKIQEVMPSLKQDMNEEVDPERLRAVVTDDLLRTKVMEWLEANGTVELVPEGTLSENEQSESEETAETAEVSS